MKLAKFHLYFFAALLSVGCSSSDTTSETPLITPEGDESSPEPIQTEEPQAPSPEPSTPPPTTTPETSEPTHPPTAPEPTPPPTAPPSNLEPISRFATPKTIHIGGATTMQWGDLDGDGDLDIFAAEGGKHRNGVPMLSWLEAPEWTRHDIDTPLTPFTGDSQIVDIDGDSDLDIVIAVDSHSGANNTGRVLWYENNGTPTEPWTQHTIEANIPDAFHIGEMVSGDIDDDGLVDIIVRHLSTNRFITYFQGPSNTWTTKRISTRHREGLAIADLNNDGLLDIIGNGYALIAPSNPRTGIWDETIFDSAFYTESETGLNNSVKIDTGDMNGDGRLDLVVSPAEGEEVYLAWYEIPSDPINGNWIRHTIESPLSNNHQVQIADVDLDGDQDLLGGFSFGDSGVVWWENTGNGQSFSRHTIHGTNGCYSCRAGDFDSDGDWDLAGPSSYVGTIFLYENMTANHPGSFLD